MQCFKKILLCKLAGVIVSSYTLSVTSHNVEDEENGTRRTTVLFQ